MSEETRRLNASIDEDIAKIEAETEKIKRFEQGRQEETLRKLEEANKRFTATEAELEGMAEEHQKLIQEHADIQNQGKAFEQEVNGVQSQIEAINAQLGLIKDRERTQLAPFGVNLYRVMAQIPQMQWHGKKPVGPLGQFVKVRDPKWAPLLRARLGGGMSIFAITDPRDRQQLDTLLKRNGK